MSDQNPNLQRAHVLLEQSRGKEAEEYARLGIQEEPNNPYAYYLLSIALASQKRHEDALQAAQSALGLSPDSAVLHFQVAAIEYQREKWKAAEDAANRALQLDPENADAYGLLAYLEARKANWKQSLTLAETGLEFDSDHVTCTNARANALMKLKRPDLAHESLDYALQRDPDNPITHYQKGRSLLESSRYDEAARHFCEALRLEPNFPEAKEGLVEALKGKHFIYSLFLKYVFFMSRLSGRAQMIIIFGGFFAQRIVSRMLFDAGYVMTATIVRIVYAAIAYFTWTASSLFNLLLLIHPLGRHALSSWQKRCSALVGGCVVAALASVAAAFATGNLDRLVPAIAFATLSLPLAALNGMEENRKRWIVIAIASAQAAIVFAGTILVYTTTLELGYSLLTIGIFIGVIFSWMSGLILR